MDEVLLSMSKIPSDDVLESLYKLRIPESAQLKTVLELYDMEIHQKKSVPNYQKLKTMVTRRKDQKLRLRNFDARHGRIESGAVVNSRKGLIGVEVGKGICYQWKEKTSVRKETDAVSGTRPKIVRKKQNTLPPHLLSHQWHEVEVCRGREVSEGKVTMDPFFDNRADFIWKVHARERLVNIGIRPRFFKNETGCQAGDKCLFPHYKVDEQPNKKSKKCYFPQRRESDDKNAVPVVKSVSPLGCVSQDSESKRQTVL